MIFFMHHDKCRLRSVSNIKHRDAGFKLGTVAVSGPDEPRSAADDEHTRVAPNAAPNDLLCLNLVNTSKEAKNWCDRRGG